MPDRLLAKSEAYEVFGLVVDVGLDPNSFTWSEEKGQHSLDGLVSDLIHQSTKYHFTFDIARTGTWYCRFLPSTRPQTMFGNIESEGINEESTAFSWNEVLRIFQEWLRRVKGIYEIPDPWATISTMRLTAIGIDNTPFNDSKRAEISHKLDHMNSILMTMQHLADNRHASITNEIAYMRGASNRLGRKDFANALIGLLSNMAVAVGTGQTTPK